MRFGWQVAALGAVSFTAGLLAGLLVGLWIR
jgi:hypothetical protein